MLVCRALHHYDKWNLEKTPPVKGRCKVTRTEAASFFRSILSASFEKFRGEIQQYWLKDEELSQFVKSQAAVVMEEKLLRSPKVWGSG